MSNSAWRKKRGRESCSWSGRIRTVLASSWSGRRRTILARSGSKPVLTDLIANTVLKKLIPNICYQYFVPKLFNCWDGQCNDDIIAQLYVAAERIKFYCWWRIIERLIRWEKVNLLQHAISFHILLYVIQFYDIKNCTLWRGGQWVRKCLASQQ